MNLGMLFGEYCSCSLETSKKQFLSIFLAKGEFWFDSDWSGVKNLIRSLTLGWKSWCGQCRWGSGARRCSRNPPCSTWVSSWSFRPEIRPCPPSPTGDPDRHPYHRDSSRHFLSTKLVSSTLRCCWSAWRWKRRKVVFRRCKTDGWLRWTSYLRRQGCRRLERRLTSRCRRPP